MVTEFDIIDAPGERVRLRLLIGFTDGEPETVLGEEPSEGEACEVTEGEAVDTMWL